MSKNILIFGFLAAWFLSSSMVQAVLINNSTWHGGDATQSSLASGGVPGRAVDGNTSGLWANSSITHTDPNTAGDAWWMFDMLTTQTIYEVDLYNRTDCCSGRMRDLTVEVYDYNNVLVDSFGPLNPENSDGGGLTDFTNGAPNPIKLWLPQATSGRYVKIIRDEADVSTGGDAPNRRVLSLAEVQIQTSNVGIGAIPTQSSTNTTYPGINALDNNLGNFTHTSTADNPTWWRADFGTDAQIDSLIIHNRDSCCGGRLRDITVEVLDADLNVVYSVADMNDDNILGGGLNDFGAGPEYLTLDFHALTGGAVTGQYVKISRAQAAVGINDDPHVLALGEVQIFGTIDQDAGTNLALNKPAVQSTTLNWSFAAPMATDGNPNNTTHTTSADTAAALEVDLLDAFALGEIELYNRGENDCCNNRLRDITVKVLDADQSVVYTSELLNPGNVLNGPEKIVLDLNGLGVTGSIVRVERTPDPNSSDPYDANVLSLGEVKVFAAVPEPGTWLPALLGLAGLVLARMRRSVS